MSMSISPSLNPIATVAHDKVEENSSNVSVNAAVSSSSSSSSPSSSSSSSSILPSESSVEAIMVCDPPSGFVHRLTGGWKFSYPIALQVFAPSKLCCTPFSKVVQTDLVFRLMQHPELLRKIDLYMPLSSHPTATSVPLIDAITHLYSTQGICSAHDCAFNERRLSQRQCLQLYSCRQSLRQTPKLFYQHWRAALSTPLKEALDPHLIPDLASLVTDYVVGDARDNQFVNAFVPDRSNGVKQFRLDLFTFKRDKLRKRLRSERFEMCGAEWEILFFPTHREHPPYQNHLWAFLHLVSFKNAVPEPPMESPTIDPETNLPYLPNDVSGHNPYIQIRYQMGLVDLQSDDGMQYRLGGDEYRFECKPGNANRGWAMADLATLERLTKLEEALTGKSEVVFEVRVQIARDKQCNIPRKVKQFVPFERFANVNSSSSSSTPECQAK